MAFNTEGTLPTYKRSGAFSFIGFHCLYMMFLGYLDVNYAKILKVGFPLYEHLGSKTPLCLDKIQILKYTVRNGSVQSIFQSTDLVKQGNTSQYSGSN